MLYIVTAKLAKSFISASEKQHGRFYVFMFARRASSASSIAEIPRRYSSSEISVASFFFSELLVYLTVLTERLMAAAMSLFDRFCQTNAAMRVSALVRLGWAMRSLARNSPVASSWREMSMWRGLLRLNSP